MALALGACAWTPVRRRIATLTTDPAAAMSDAPWAGGAAIVGIMAWTVSAAALLIGAHVLRNAGTDPRRARLLTESGIVLAAFAVDDAFLVHEYWVPRLTGAPDMATYLVLFGAAAAVAVRNGRALEALPVAPLAMIGAAFAASLVLDVVFDALQPFRGASALEDIPKLWALGMLAVTSVRESLTAPPQAEIDLVSAQRPAHQASG